MKFTLLLLAVCLSSAYSASINKDDGPPPGDVTQENSYSVLLSLINGPNIIRFCGGARIGREWFITAAECLESEQADKLMLTFSTYTYNYIPVPIDLKSIEKVIHPEYNRETKANNLALIRCERCGRQDENKLPSVPSKNDADNSFSQEPAVATGMLDNTNESTPVLFYVRSLKATITHPFWCRVLYFYKGVGESHICASGEGGKGLAVGDVGAPLVIEEKSTGLMKLVGVATSITPWTTSIPLPMVFTRITSYMDWIRQVTNISL